MDNLTPSQIIQLASVAKGYWRPRNKKFEEWYRIITLDDSDIYQENMECVISNDPKTFFRKAVKLLSSGVTHTIPTDLLARPESVNISPIIKFLEMEWQSKEQEYRRRGRLAWLVEFSSFLAATGWYDVLVYASESDGLVAEVRNPANCFPSFSSGGEGLNAHFHTYSISTAEAVRKCQKHGWRLERPFPKTGTVTVIDYWVLGEDGFPYNYIVIGNQLVKPGTRESFDRIPILSGFAVGLPDRGAILQDQKWQERLGESIISDNEEVYKNLNKSLSFTQQLIRDVAQPKMYEKLETNTSILNSETMYKRGAIFRMGVGEDIGTLAPAPLPVELSLHTRSLEDMIQRGSFPWTMFGGLTAAITSYTQSQITAAAQEILSPYADAIKEVISEIDNIWISAMREKQLVIHGWQIPRDFPEFLKAVAEVAVSIPGDFIQRATLSRMIAPGFEVTTKTAMEMLWSEIKDPDREIAGTRAQAALQHPVATTINLISGFRQQAAIMRQAGDNQTAALYEKAASAAEATIKGMLAGGGNGRQPPITGRTEVMPREQIAEEELLT